METLDNEAVSEPPKYGLKLHLNNVYPLQSKQIIVPRLKQIYEMMPLSIRYLRYHFGKWINNKKPIMNYINMVSAQRMYGCPIGGIGGGTIGRGYKGEFCRFQLTPGIYEYVTVPECQFIVNIRNENNETIFQSVLSTYTKPKKAPPSWEWNLDGSKCEYTALYPRAWTTYDLSEYGIKLVCRQISPVIPHNYKDSSLPCAVFVFTATNICDKHRYVSITFTWTEVLNNNNKKTTAKLDLERYSEEYTCGVTLEQKIKDTQCTFTIAKKKQDSETIHEGYCLWNATKTASYVWECLKENGRLAPDLSQNPAPPKINDKAAKAKQEKPRKLYKSDSIGLSDVVSLEPGQSGMTEFCLAWDMPLIKYANENKVYKRYYTKYFGSDGIAGASIAAYALRNYTQWERQLAEWQDPILNNSNIPDWLKSALMNELYFIADGGTIWFDVADDYPDSDPRHDFGLFGYLEGHEYRMYNTYDVHFYASFALAQLWPNLQVVIQYMFRDTIELETKKCRQSMYDGKVVKYKIKGTIPHDLGDPEGVPFSKINAYNIHDVSEWRDLNLKFILQVMRDFRLLRGFGAPFNTERYRHMAYIDDVKPGTEDDLYTRATEQEATPPGIDNKSPSKISEFTPPPDVVTLLEAGDAWDARREGGAPAPAAPAPAWGARRYLEAMYPACAALYRVAASWDRDHDGLIENAGLPDQTYDAWLMTGPSAYCGSLWVASLTSLRSMANFLGYEQDEIEYSKVLERARQAYHDKLWTGAFYRFDTRPRNEKVVMSDQLVGHWFLRASGITEHIFPEMNVKKALRSIFENNVLKFKGGKMGAVNGYVAGEGGHVDTTALQSEEMWTGVTYGLAATMIYEGMNEEAFVTAGGLNKTLTDMGLAFETPEALYENGNHRSIAYMRPLAIWAMYQAIISKPPITPIPTTNGVANHAKEKSTL